MIVRGANGGAISGRHWATRGPARRSIHAFQLLSSHRNDDDRQRHPRSHRRVRIYARSSARLEYRCRPRPGTLVAIRPGDFAISRPCWRWLRGCYPFISPCYITVILGVCSSPLTVIVATTSGTAKGRILLTGNANPLTTTAGTSERRRPMPAIAASVATEATTHQIPGADDGLSFREGWKLTGAQEPTRRYAVRALCHSERVAGTCQVSRSRNCPVRLMKGRP
jgi:hypothetical protein